MAINRPSDYEDVLHPTFVEYLKLEEEATRLWSFQPLVIHGLLQTRRYAEALIKDLTPTWFHDPEITARLERQLAARMARQAILERDGVEFHFIIEEAALRRRFWGPKGTGILHEQLERFRELPMYPEQPRLQYLPFSRAVFDAMVYGPFTLLDDVEGSRWLYREQLSGQSTLTDDPEQIEFCHNMFLDLANLAVVFNGDHVYGWPRGVPHGF